MPHQRTNMEMSGRFSSLLAMVVVGALAGCSTACSKAIGSAMGQIASNRVVSSEIPAATPADPDVDIARNLDAALIRNRLHVKYAVNNHVVTLTGAVNSPLKRARAEKIAAAVINVQRVVNELQVKRRETRFPD